ncbi:MAG: TetR/AcrR family transcriptional regulator [Paracoccaceae bacterium]|nr:TetR/AcrR family transcriptional regulator [Paracoccaceae bacterium]
MSEAEKQKSHARIINAAARLFRNEGVGATSISDVMQAAGLTHGGFYRHFPSKEALIEAAFSKAVDDLLAEWETAETEHQKEQAREDYLSRYLSLGHAQNAGSGCPVATMGAELATHGKTTKAETSKAIERTSRVLDPRGNVATDQGIATMATLVGTITLARLANSEDEAEKIIEAGKQGVQHMLENWA